MMNWPLKKSQAEVTPLPKRAGEPGMSTPERDPADRLRISKPGRLDPRLVSLLRPGSPAAESYFRLRHSIESMAGPEGAIVVGVTSPAAGDGKTLTAVNLAGALARDSRARVLLVNLDLRSTGTDIETYLDLEPHPGPGLADWVDDPELPAERIIRRVGGFDIDVVAPGSAPEFLYEFLKAPRLEAFLELARRKYRFIVVDTPHALMMSDVALLARLVDGYLIVVRAGHTTQQDLESTLNLVSQHKVLGLVFNADPASRRKFAR